LVDHPVYILLYTIGDDSKYNIWRQTTNLDNRQNRYVQVELFKIFETPFWWRLYHLSTDELGAEIGVQRQRNYLPHKIDCLQKFQNAQVLCVRRVHI